MRLTQSKDPKKTGRANGVRTFPAIIPGGWPKPRHVEAPQFGCSSSVLSAGAEA